MVKPTPWSDGGRLDGVRASCVPYLERCSTSNMWEFNAAARAHRPKRAGCCPMRHASYSYETQDPVSDRQRIAESSRPHSRNTLTRGVHDPDFRQAERDFYGFVDKLTERLIEIDETIPELPVKDVVSYPRSVSTSTYGLSLTVSLQIFRIYRDVRFSKVRCRPLIH